MDPARGAVWTAASLIVLTALVSGPAVPGIDLTRSPAESGLSFGGEDELDVSVVSIPTTDVRLEQGQYGAGAYYLRVPDAVVDVERVRGNPRLVYKLNVAELGYVRATVHFVEENREGDRLSLALEQDTFAPDRIDAEEYDGVLKLVARTDDRAETLARQNVTVEVRS